MDWFEKFEEDCVGDWQAARKIWNMVRQNNGCRNRHKKNCSQGLELTFTQYIKTNERLIRTKWDNEIKNKILKLCSDF